MDLLDAGYAFEHISATYGIHAAHLKVLRSKYLQQGPVGLEKDKYKSEYGVLISVSTRE